MSARREGRLTLPALCRALACGALSSLELTRRCLGRLERLEPTVGAFLTLDAPGALAAAAASDRRRQAGAPLHPLDGVPYAVKDNLCTRGLRTTCASRMLENYIPPYDADAVARLRGAGCVLLGKLNMDEFSFGSTTMTSALGVTRNPLDPARVPGGSSGGAAAAVAAGELPFAVGSDTGGSVRQPAAFCGVIGFKPAAGRISRYGLVAFAPSLDCVGVLANTAADAARVYALLAQPLPAQELLPADDSGAGLSGVRVAVPPQGWGPPLSDAVGRALDRGADCLRRAGALLCTADCLPPPETALLSYVALSTAEAASDLARFDGIRFGGPARDPSALPDPAEVRGDCFGPEVKRRILLGTALLSGEFRARCYQPACLVREAVRDGFARLFGEAELLLTPTVPGGAPRADVPLSPREAGQMDLYTVPASLAGLPALSVPFGRDENAMPLGLQLVAPPGREALLFRAGAILEAAGGWLPEEVGNE